MTNTSIAFLEKYLGLVLCAFFTAGRKTMMIFRRNEKTDGITKRIVFVKFIEQGALVLHLATFKEAATRYGAENVFICTFSSNAQLVDILDVIPSANRIFINEQGFIVFAMGFLKAAMKIRSRNIDAAIDLEFYSRATAIFCYLSGAVKRVGYHRYMGSQNYRGDLFTHKLSYSHYVHLAGSSWSMLKSLEISVPNLPALDIQLNNSLTEFRFTPDANDLKRLNQLLGEVKNNERLVVINPSLNDVLPLRKWPAENYRTFILEFNNRFPHHKFVFTGRVDEYDLTEKFITSFNLPDVVNLCGKTELKDILTLYSRAKLLLTSDSGPAHFSTLTNVNAIVLFGPETPVLYGPLSEKIKVIYQGLPCSPCYNVYNNRLSPCRNNVCMQKISVEQVLETASQFLV